MENVNAVTMASTQLTTFTKTNSNSSLASKVNSSILSIEATPVKTRASKIVEDPKVLEELEDLVAQSQEMDEVAAVVPVILTEIVGKLQLIIHTHFWRYLTSSINSPTCKKVANSTSRNSSQTSNPNSLACET